MTPDQNNHSSEITALKNQCFSLLMALIVVSGTVTVYMYRQASLAGSDLKQAKQLEALISQNEAGIETFLRQLVAYGQVHPDFTPVLKKYGLTLSAPPAAAAVPAKAPAAAPKK